jgi:hypothetical protein
MSDIPGGIDLPIRMDLQATRIVIHRGRRWVMRFDLSDEEWSVLEPLMPKSRKSARPHDRRIINAIFYVLRTGIPWRDLPVHERVQSVQPLVSARSLEAYFRCAGGKIARQFVLDR